MPRERALSFVADAREPHLAPFTLFTAEGKAIDASERKSLIERSRAGEHIELELEGPMFLQGAKPGEMPNRNFIRFRNGAMGPLAKSGKSTPFLRDHAQRSQADRGGTIVESKLEKSDDGVRSIVQRVRLTTPWAVQGALDGTIDRFSIGWRPTGPIVYAHSGEEIEDWPKHWPGDELEDGTIVEWEFTAAELVETSSVNVPAVVGTGIDAIRSAWTAAVNQPVPPAPQKEPAMGFSPELKKRLGLVETATDEEVVARLEAREAEGAAARERLEATQAKLAEEQRRIAVETERVRDEKVEQRIRELKAKGALAMADSATEVWLRGVAKSQGLEAFEKTASEIPAGIFHLGGSPRQVDSKQPPALGTGVIAFDEERRARMARLGLNEKSYEHAPDRWQGLGSIPAKKGA